MRNYFLSHVFDTPNEGVPGAKPGAPAGDTAPPGTAPPAGDPPAADAGAAGQDGAPKPPKAPKERTKEDIMQDRFAELTRRNTEAAGRAAAEKARADKAEGELRAARELLSRQTADPNADPAAPPTQPKFRPLPDERSLDDILNSDEGKQAIAKRAQAEREASEISARGDEIYEQAVEQFGEAKVTKALANFKMFDGIKPELAESVFELGDDAAAVLMEIASKPAIIEQLYKLKPVQLATRVNAIATTIKKPPISKVGEPPGEMGGRGNAGPIAPTDTNASMADWVRSREEDLKKRGVRL
jgi:hypothetical protein